jgi:hypothetical protein
MVLGAMALMPGMAAASSGAGTANALATAALQQLLL